METEKDLAPSDLRSLIEDLFWLLRDQPPREQHIMIDPKVLQGE